MIRNPHAAMLVRRAVQAGALVGLLTAVAACSSGEISRPRIETAVAPTFANLYSLRLSKLGHSGVDPATFHVTASCDRGGPNVPDRGAGADWTCNISWLTAGPGTPATAAYHVHVQTDGCYTADGDGPQEINGLQTIITAEGQTTTNPLWQFDGCFERT